MGLLLKAERGLQPAESVSRTGLLAKAREALSVPADTAPAAPEPLPPEEDRGDEAVPEAAIPEAVLPEEEVLEVLPLEEAVLETLPDFEDAAPIPEMPELAREPGFDASDLAVVAAEVAALPPGFDLTLRIFDRIVETFELEGLAVLVPFGEELRVAASYGSAFGAVDLRLPAAVVEGLKATSGRLSAPAQASLVAAGLSVPDAEGPFYAHASFEGPGEARLWLVALPLGRDEEELWKGFSAILEAGGKPPLASPAEEVADPASEAESLRLGSGRAIVHAYNLGPDLVSLKARAPNAQAWYVDIQAARCATALAGPDGRAWLGPRGRMVLLSYVQKETDLELSRIQHRKSLQRGLSSLLGPHLDQGASLALDLSQAQALADLEGFLAV